MFAIGGKVGFFQGDIKNLSEDLKEIKPTLFCTVPRLLNRVYSVVFYFFIDFFFNLIISSNEMN